MADIVRIRAIYERHADRAYRAAFVILKDPQDAEDVMQSVFVTLLEKDISFENERHETAWIIRTVRNRCLDIQKNKWHRGVSLLDDAGELKDSSAAAEDEPGGEAETLTEMLMSLPAVQREALFLKYYEGFTVAETAGIMGMKESSVRSAIRSAKRNLTKGK